MGGISRVILGRKLSCSECDCTSCDHFFFFFLLLGEVFRSLAGLAWEGGPLCKFLVG